MFGYLAKGLPILVAAGLVLTGGTAMADITTGLEVHYQFADDTTEADLGYNSVTALNDGLGGTGTLTQVAGPGGLIPDGASFGTVADSRHIAVAGKSNIGEGSFTLSAWVNTDNGWADSGCAIHGRTPSWDVVLLELRSLWGPQGQIEGENANAFVRDYIDYSTNVSIDIRDTANLADGDWHHMASTWDGTTDTLKLYVDGVLAKTKTQAIPGPLDVSDYRVGTRAFDEGLHLDGSLADVRMYGRLLSDGGVGVGEIALGDMGELYGLVPEPSSFLLAALGLLSVAFVVSRRRE